MQRIDTPTAVNGHFVNANPNIGRMATRLDENWFNTVQEELCNVVEGLGNALDKEKRNQIISALASRMFDYREVNAAVTPSITLSTLMKKTIVKMTGRTLTVNGEFDVLVVVPGNLDVISYGATVTVESSGITIPVGRGIVIWGNGINTYSKFPGRIVQNSVVIEPAPETFLPNDISSVPASSVASLTGVSENRKNMDISASVLFRSTELLQTANGAAWICNASGTALKKVPFKFLIPNASSYYVSIVVRFAFETQDRGTFSLRIACDKNVSVVGGTVSYLESDT